MESHNNSYERKLGEDSTTHNSHVYLHSNNDGNSTRPESSVNQ